MVETPDIRVATELLQQQLQDRCELYWTLRRDHGCEEVRSSIKTNRVFLQGGYKAGRLSSGFVQEQEEKIVQIERELTECERQEEEIEAEIESGKVTESTPDQITRLSAKIEELSLEASRIFSVIMD